MIPIAWWAIGPRRRRILAGVAVIAIIVQLAGVFAWYGVSVRIQGTLSGQHTYLYGGFPANDGRLRQRRAHLDPGRLRTALPA